MLPSRFFAARRVDRLGEGWTHADAVIGHVNIGDGAIADACLQPTATQFVVTEAKLFSPLSADVTNARFYDQAARNVACLAEVLSRAARSPKDVQALAFYVIAPESRIGANVFSGETTRESIKGKVERRVAEYGIADVADKIAWLEQWFLPTLEEWHYDV